MAHAFYVIMQKRRDDKVYADLHKTDACIYLTEAEAEGALAKMPLSRFFHVVELVAETREQWEIDQTQPIKGD